MPASIEVIGISGSHRTPCMEAFRTTDAESQHYCKGEELESIEGPHISVISFQTCSPISHGISERSCQLRSLICRATMPLAMVNNERAPFAFGSFFCTRSDVLYSPIQSERCLLLARTSVWVKTWPECTSKV